MRKRGYANRFINVGALIFVALAPSLVLAAQKSQTRWIFRQSGAEFVLNVEVGPADMDIAGFTLFSAACKPGKATVDLWFYVDQELFPGQTEDASGRRQPYRNRHAAVIIDDAVYPLANTVLKLEEDYRGHELTARVSRDAELFAAMKNGRAMAIRVDNLTMQSFSLEGAAKALGDFTTQCNQRKRNSAK